jgi:outer membrane protein assembly factor BamB
MNPLLYVQRKSMRHLVRFSDRCFDAIRTSALFAVLGSSMSLTSPTTAADWPEFRGDSQNGTIPDRPLPLKWSESENVRWYQPTKGLGWSSPIIVGEKIFLTTAVSPDGSDDSSLGGPKLLQLVCLDAATGKSVFEKTIFDQTADAPTIHNKNSHASPTPLHHKGKLYLHFGHQGTACTDLKGELIWENRDHIYPPTHGNGGSPIVVDDMLIVTCDGGSQPYTLALDLQTGQERWKTPRGISADRPFSFCTPQKIVVNGQTQIVSPGSDIVQSLNPKDGEVIWYANYSGFSVVPRPVFHEGLVFLSTGFMRPNLLAIDPTGKGDVTKSHIKWSYKGSVPNTPSFVPYGNQIILVSDEGVAAGVDVKTGKEVWKKRIGGNFSASVIVVGNKLFLQSEGGESIVYKLEGEPEELHRNTLPGRIFATYAVHENDWIIRTEAGVYRIGNL